MATVNSLGERLGCVYSLVPRGSRFLDIGTDHGLLPVRLICDGIVASAAAADINEKPLCSARRTAMRAGVDMAFFLADGFDGVDYDYNVAAICGMGGHLIVDILSRASVQPGTRLIIQPMRDARLVRAYLWDNGFTIELERYVVESNRPYLVLSCVKTGERTLHDATDEYLGLSDDMSCERREYELKLLRSLRKRRRDDSGVVSRVIRVLEERYGV